VATLRPDAPRSLRGGPPTQKPRAAREERAMENAEQSIGDSDERPDRRRSDRRARPGRTDRRDRADRAHSRERARAAHRSRARADRRRGGERDPDCLIVGGGPAGLTAAVYLARFRRDVLLIDAGEPRAALIPTSRNCPGFPDGIRGPDLLRTMRAHAERFDV